MRSYLNGYSKPLELQIESILPGVNSALNALKSTVEDGFNFTRRDIHQLQVGVNDIVTSQEEQRTELAAALMDYAARLTGSSSVPQLRDEEDSTTRMRDGDDDGVEEALALQENPFLVYSMVLKHKTLSDLIDEWRGEGLFDDGTGGIKGRDKAHGTKWRQHINKQHYSRTKRVAIALEEHARNNNRNVKEVCHEFQKTYEELSCSVANLVRAFQEQGLIQKKGARGKQKTTI